MKAIVIAVGLLAAGIAHADTSAAKKELIEKILKIQQPMIEVTARGLAEQPAQQIAQRAAMAIQVRIPSEKREAVSKEIQADLMKYADEATPIVRDRAVKLAPTTIGAQLDKNFSEDELRQLVAMLESPVNKKFAQHSAEMQKGLIEALVNETRPQIEPKIKALEVKIARRLGINPDEAGKAAAKQAAKPAEKAAEK